MSWTSEMRNRFYRNRFYRIEKRECRKRNLSVFILCHCDSMLIVIESPPQLYASDLGQGGSVEGGADGGASLRRVCRPPVDVPRPESHVLG